MAVEGSVSEAGDYVKDLSQDDGQNGLETSRDGGGSQGADQGKCMGSLGENKELSP